LLKELGLFGFDAGGIPVFQHHKHGIGCVRT
jgi:hypothetical protein